MSYLWNAFHYIIWYQSKMQQMQIGENKISKFKQHCSIKYQEKIIIDLMGQTKYNKLYHI